MTADINAVITDLRAARDLLLRQEGALKDIRLTEHNMHMAKHHIDRLISHVRDEAIKDTTKDTAERAPERQA